MLNTNDLQRRKTPFYVYDMELLSRTLDAIKAETAAHDNYLVHYAIKANSNPAILRHIASAGLGADCVSGGEIKAALKAGFPASKIAFAGVGKSNQEIKLALEAGICMFNVESTEELIIIQQLAKRYGKRARVSFRINPDIAAHTHGHITTGRAEDKFGIAKEDMVHVVRLAQALSNIDFTGLHFHIGSQLLEMNDFEALCGRINELQDELDREGLFAPNINVGGGLGIDYEHPDEHPIADFKAYFDTFKRGLQLREGQRLHFELGRAVVAQMGALITKVLYVKQGQKKQFVIVDAGMTELIRPALYGALHQIENLSAQKRSATQKAVLYDVVGPICESSDVFARDYRLPLTKRGDLLALRSAGAYGETMASQYNCRQLPKSILI